jgi:hypothetical protein
MDEVRRAWWNLGSAKPTLIWAGLFKVAATQRHQVCDGYGGLAAWKRWWL